MQSKQWEDLLTPERREVLSEVKIEYENAQFLVSKPSGQRKRKPKLKAPVQKSDSEDPVKTDELDFETPGESPAADNAKGNPS